MDHVPQVHEAPGSVAEVLVDGRRSRSPRGDEHRSVADDEVPEASVGLHGFAFPKQQEVVVGHPKQAAPRELLPLR
jgi:hypothetical protein